MPMPIDRAELERRLGDGSPPVLVEALGPAYYADVHLPGAVNIPPDAVSSLAPALLPDLDAEIVVYCSATCSNAEATAAALEGLGYRSVRVYGAGKEEWIEHGLPVQRDAAGPAA